MENRKKSTIIFGNKNMLNWVLLIKLFKFNYTLTSKRDNLTFHATYETWYFFFLVKQKVYNTIPLFSRKLKGDALFLHCWK